MIEALFVRYGVDKHPSRAARDDKHEDLQEFRGNGWALFGLWQTLRDQGRTTEAAEVRQRFDRAWREALTWA